MSRVDIVIGLLLASVAPRGYAANAKENELKEFITCSCREDQAIGQAGEPGVVGRRGDRETRRPMTGPARCSCRSGGSTAIRRISPCSRGIKESGQVQDPLLARQLTVLYNAYLANQIEPNLLQQIVELGTQIEKNFSTFRGSIDGKKVTDNEIKDILKDETDSAKREKAWLASKQVGAAVAADLVRLVKLRNEAARKLGFDNYHTMALATGEQDVKELDRIFADLYERTNKPFAKVKAELDQILAKKYGITPDAAHAVALSRPVLPGNADGL